MHDVFEALAIDDRFSELPVALHRSVGSGALGYSIMVGTEHAGLETFAGLADFVKEHDLVSTMRDGCIELHGRPDS